MNPAISNKSIYQFLLLTFLLFGSIGLSAEDLDEKLVVSIVRSDPSHSLVSLKTEEFEEEVSIPNDMDIDSTLKLKTLKGKTIVVKRDTQGFKVELEGKTVVLPKFKGKYGVKLTRNSPLHPKIEKDIVVSGAQFSPEQIKIIKRAFADAGVSKPIKFSQHRIISVNTSKDSSSTIISTEQKVKSEISVFFHEQHISIQSSKEEEKPKKEN